MAEIDFDQIEKDVVEQLSSLTPANEVIQLPETQSEFERAFAKSKIAVAYAGSTYRETEDSGFIVQRGKIKIMLIIQSRKLRGQDGLYDVLDKAAVKLIGFEPTYCGKMYLVEEVPLKSDDSAVGLFTYSQTYECFSIRSQTIPDEAGAPIAEDGVTFTRIENEEV